METHSSLVACIKQFVKKRAIAILENGFEACKQTLIQFETLQSNFHSKADFAELTVTKLAIMFSKARFVFSKFGRVVSMYEVLFQKLKSVTNEYCFNSTLFTNDPRMKFTTKVPLEHFSAVDKSALLTTNYFVVQRRIWRNQYDEDRAKIVPVIICRVCA